MHCSQRAILHSHIQSEFEAFRANIFIFIVAQGANKWIKLYSFTQLPPTDFTTISFSHGSSTVLPLYSNISAYAIQYSFHFVLFTAYFTHYSHAVVQLTTSLNAPSLWQLILGRHWYIWHRTDKWQKISERKCAQIVVEMHHFKARKLYRVFTLKTSNINQIFCMLKFLCIVKCICEKFKRTRASICVCVCVEIFRKLYERLHIASNF